jgi:hypothetical protein
MANVNCVSANSQSAIATALRSRKVQAPQHSSVSEAPRKLSVDARSDECQRATVKDLNVRPGKTRRVPAQISRGARAAVCVWVHLQHRKPKPRNPFQNIALTPARLLYNLRATVWPLIAR